MRPTHPPHPIVCRFASVPFCLSLLVAPGLGLTLSQPALLWPQCVLHGQTAVPAPNPLLCRFLSLLILK